jgi:hypothetical protein
VALHEELGNDLGIVIHRLLPPGGQSAVPGSV